MTFLKPKTINEMVRKVTQLPPSKRKVIILVGRHPHEGTTNIGWQFHKEWEKHGAVVVKLPGEWTPHGFWKMAEKQWDQKRSSKGLKEKSEEIPTDETIIELLKNGKDTPIINLHGAPYRTEETKSKIVIFTHSQATRRIKKALEVLPDKVIRVEESDDKYQHPSEVLVEHYFQGKPPSIAALLRKRKMSAMIELNPGPHLNIEYLKKQRITKAALERFRKTNKPTLDKLIKALAKR